MPAQLVNAVSVAFENIVLRHAILVQDEDADGLVEASACQPTAVAAPVDRVNFGRVGLVVFDAAVGLEICSECLHMTRKRLQLLLRPTSVRRHEA